MMVEMTKYSCSYYIFNLRIYTCFSGSRPEIRNHYRGHKMSLWLNLIPQLHRPGDGDDVSMRHHHFQEEDDEYYDGKQNMSFETNPSQKIVVLSNIITEHNVLCITSQIEVLVKFESMQATEAFLSSNVKKTVTICWYFVN